MRHAFRFKRRIPASLYLSFSFFLRSCPAASSFQAAKRKTMRILNMEAILGSFRKSLEGDSFSFYLNFGKHYENFMLPGLET